MTAVDSWLLLNATDGCAIAVVWLVHVTAWSVRSSCAVHHNSNVVFLERHWSLLSACTVDALNRRIAGKSVQSSGVLFCFVLFFSAAEAECCCQTYATVTWVVFWSPERVLSENDFGRHKSVAAGRCPNCTRGSFVSWGNWNFASDKKNVWTSEFSVTWWKKA